jgi:tetratricopeptide (TPR) repeat protein
MTRILSGGFGDPEGLRIIRTHANKALDLDPGLADGHALLGALSLYADWDWTHAEKELKLAVELNPSDAGLYHPYADSLLVQGRVDESVAAIRKGLALDPLSPIVASPLIFHLCFARRFDEAIEEWRGFQKEFPGASVGRTFLRYALWYKGAHEEAVEEYRSDWRNNPDLLKVFEQGLAKAGPRGAMRAVAQLLDSRSSSEKVSAMGVAGFYARAGDVDSAMRWLERAYQGREVMMPHVRFDPDYDVLHSDPRFQDLLRRMNFPK